jgi:hypothetical protein
MQPIDVRKLEALRRFKLLRRAYRGSPIETSAADGGRHGAPAACRTDRRGTRSDPGT